MAAKNKRRTAEEVEAQAKEAGLAVLDGPKGTAEPTPEPTPEPIDPTTALAAAAKAFFDAQPDVAAGFQNAMTIIQEVASLTLTYKYEAPEIEHIHTRRGLKWITTIDGNFTIKDKE